MKVTNLKVCGMTNPIGIDAENPIFSYVLEGENVFQKSYRILVSSSRELLDKNVGDMWDSKEVVSDETINIVYDGKPLESCAEYFWKVTVNKLSSAQATFETAFLDPAKFKAYWIGQPLGFGGSADNIRWDFEVEKPVKRAYFYVCALGAAKFYLNGKPLSDGYFDGAIGIYEKSVAYRTYKLDLKEGKNCLCARIGYGFYGSKKMYGALFAEFTDGTASCGVTNPGRVWVTKRGAITMHGVYDGETYDASKEENWLDLDYKVTFGNWVATFSADGPKGKLRANTIPPMRIVKTFDPESVTKTEEGYLVNTGVNVCGFLTIKVKGERGAKLNITHSERLFPDGRLDNANLRAAECTDNYILKGEGEESFTPLFTYHGFQYALIKTTGNVEIIDIKVNYLRIDLEEVGKFSCDNKMLNRLHEIAVQTEGNNLNGTFTDCPQRDERAGWLNDLTSRIYQTICNFSMQNYLPNFINMQSEVVETYGTLTDTVPYTIGCMIADPVCAYTILGKFVLDFFSDTQTVEKNYPYFKKWIEYLKKDADNNGGVVNHAIYGDWVPAKIFAKPDNGHTFSLFVEPRYVSAIYFLWYLKQMKQIAEAIGKNKDAREYQRLYTKYKANFDRKYLDYESGLYGSGSQTELAIAITVFDEEKSMCERFARIINQDVINHGYHMTCGNQGYRHLLYNLCEYGYADTACKMLLNEEYPSWGYMLKNGATTVWERWENEVGSDMHSFNHPMLASYDGIFYNYILGIRMAKCEDAFKKIVIEPCFVKDVNNCEGEYKTIRGKISVKWQKLDDGVKVEISTPANTNLEFIAKGKTIEYNGKQYEDSLELTNGKFTLFVK